MQESDADFLRKCEICLKVKHELDLYFYIDLNIIYNAGIW